MRGENSFTPRLTGSGGSNCCEDNGSPGCSDPECEATVCATDPFCCSVSWDGICADEGIEFCGIESCTGGGDDGGGVACNCCAETGGPGCDCPSCVDTVCATDAFCCSVSWDSICGAEAETLCDCCAGQTPGTCDDGGGDDGGSDDGGGVPCDCCTDTGNLGCDCDDCEATVCGVDPFCCSVTWDSICAESGLSLCTCCDGQSPGTCDDGGGDDGGAGCVPGPITQNLDDSFIESLASVSCNAGGNSTDNQYYRVYDLAGDHGLSGVSCIDGVTFGVETAQGGPQTLEVVVSCLPFGTVAGGVIANADITANLAASANVVVEDTDLDFVSVAITACCDADTEEMAVGVLTPDCQESDECFGFFIGANTAGDIAPCYIGAPDCGILDPIEVGLIGFPDMACIINPSLVCDDPGGEPCNCCDDQQGDAGGVTSDCCDPDGNGTPGCDCFACEDMVCGFDSFCCSVEWDSVCADAAGDCEVCLPGGFCDAGDAGGDDGDAGGDDGPEGPVGCDCPPCEETVCGADPFCCSVAWDGLCAEQALELCNCCANQDPGTCEVVDEDPPICELIDMDPGPPMQILVYIEDPGSGIDTIVPTVQINADVDIDPFAPGSNDPLFVVGTKIDQNEAAVLELTVTDVAGNQTVCDPVLAKLVIPGRARAMQETFIGIPDVEHYIVLENDSPGVRDFGIIVNGTPYGPVTLKPGEKDMIDVVDAMIEGNNNVMTLRVNGWPGGQIFALISDSPGTQTTSFTEGDSTKLPAPGEQMVNLTWGRTKEIGPKPSAQDQDDTRPGEEQSSVFK